MKFIKLTYTEGTRVVEYTINCDRIKAITQNEDVTMVDVGISKLKVDQTPQQILELIQGGKNEQD